MVTVALFRFAVVTANCLRRVLFFVWMPSRFTRDKPLTVVGRWRLGACRPRYDAGRFHSAISSTAPLADR